MSLECFPGGSDSKESPCNMGDLGLTPELGRSPGEGNSYPLQYSCLENFMDRGAWQADHSVAKSWTQLSDFHFRTLVPSGEQNVTVCTLMESRVLSEMLNQKYAVTFVKFVLLYKSTAVTCWGIYCDFRSVKTI